MQFWYTLVYRFYYIFNSYLLRLMFYLKTPKTITVTGRKRILAVGTEVKKLGLDGGDDVIIYIMCPEDELKMDMLIENYYYGMLDGEQEAEAERLLRERFGGKISIGNIYIDRWDANGEFIQGGSFLYYEGETMRDYCDRNGEPYPVREIPEEIIELFEAGDLEGLKKWRKEMPDLKLKPKNHRMKTLLL